MSLHMLMVDTVEEQALLTLQSSLRSVGSLLALSNPPLLHGQYGLCAAVHTGKGVTLQAGYCAVPAEKAQHYSFSCCVPQMLLRPQPFDLRQWHFALEKLTCSPDAAAADDAKTGMLIYST